MSRYGRHGTRYWRPSLAERILSRTEQTSGCWIWRGQLSGNGYGMFRDDDGRIVGAHRAAYELHRGSIPQGLVIDHLCRNRQCVNPDHMECVTVGENSRRGVGLPWMKLREATHCKYGHEFTPENTYRTPGRNGRACRICIRRRLKESAERRREVTAQ